MRNITGDWGGGKIFLKWLPLHKMNERGITIALGTSREGKGQFISAWIRKFQ